MKQHTYFFSRNHFVGLATFQQQSTLYMGTMLSKAGNRVHFFLKVSVCFWPFLHNLRQAFPGKVSTDANFLEFSFKRNMSMSFWSSKSSTNFAWIIQNLNFFINSTYVLLVAAPRTSQAGLQPYTVNALPYPDYETEVLDSLLAVLINVK